MNGKEKWKLLSLVLLLLLLLFLSKALDIIDVGSSVCKRSRVRKIGLNRRQMFLTRRTGCHINLRIAIIKPTPYWTMDMKMTMDFLHALAFVTIMNPISHMSCVSYLWVELKAWKHRCFVIDFLSESRGLNCHRYNRSDLNFIVISLVSPL
jgi:hypothetical protein